MTVAHFPTTRRSIVLALSSDDAAARTRAFDTLVALYKYARVAWRRSAPAGSSRESSPVASERVWAAPPCVNIK
ncbi:MAG: hypothetical protein ACREXW_17765 [Gammaproteobacteria bacterium]